MRSLVLHGAAPLFFLERQGSRLSAFVRGRVRVRGTRLRRLRRLSLSILFTTASRTVEYVAIVVLIYSNGLRFRIDMVDPHLQLLLE